MNEPMSDQSPRAANPLSLANMGHAVFSILEQRQTTSFNEVADLIVGSIGPTLGLNSASEQRTVQRRVYDVLNVFLAAGFIAKDNKTIRFVPSAVHRHTPETAELVRARTKLKLASLVDKLRLLIFHKLLIERNARRARALDAVQLPCIFVGFTDVGNGVITKTLTGLQLQIAAQSPPLFFSPMNVFEGIGFDVAEQKRCLQEMDIPERLLESLQSLMFAREDAAPGRECPAKAWGGAVEAPPTLEVVARKIE